MLALREGDRISNYLLEARVGTGSFAEVWRARHHVFGDVVAIKIPTDAQYVRNLQREGVAIHGLRHPNIVGAVDIDPHGDPPYLIMDYIDGPSLREVIDKQRNTFPIEAAASILRGILLALTAAHDQSIIHRDLKPANILLHRPPDDLSTVTDRSVRVADFGLGHVGGVTTQSMMQSGSLLTDEGRSIAGTLAYMSPEQRAGDDLDARSDLYSCGIILFEMLTGERPQGSELPSALRGEIPARFDRLFERCYARRERRFGSAGEMLAALSAGAEKQRPAAPPPPLGMVCPACNRPIHRNDQFCIHCGVQVVESVPRCAACQAFVQSSDRFCIFCGNDLRVLA